MADELQIPDARIAVVSHPIGGSPRDSLVARADAAVSDLVDALG